MLLRLLIGASLLALPAPAHAQGMKVEPGKWEFKHTMPSPTGGAPIEAANTECIREDTMTPGKFMSEMKECRISDVVTSETSMDWKLACSSQGGTMTGNGSFRSSGPTASGTLKMTMSMGGQKMTMETSWAGRRVGDCE